MNNKLEAVDFSTFMYTLFGKDFLENFKNNNKILYNYLYVQGKELYDVSSVEMKNLNDMANTPSDKYKAYYNVYKAWKPIYMYIITRKNVIDPNFVERINAINDKVNKKLKLYKIKMLESINKDNV